MASRKAFFLESAMFMVSQNSWDNSYAVMSLLLAVKEASCPIKLVNQIIGNQEQLPFGANHADADLILLLCGHPLDSTKDRIYTQSWATLPLLTKIADRLAHVHRLCTFGTELSEALLLGSAVIQERGRKIDG